MERQQGTDGFRLPMGPQSVGFTLSQLGLETSRRFGELVGTLGLEPRHFAVLRAVQQQEGQSQQAVAERLGIPPSTMVSLVDALEEHGLVERRLQGSDRRTRTLHLTDLGAEVLTAALHLALRFEETICSGIDPSERAHLLLLLDTVAANLGVGHEDLPDKGCGVAPALLAAQGERPKRR